MLELSNQFVNSNELYETFSGGRRECLNLSICVHNELYESNS